MAKGRGDIRKKFGARISELRSKAGFTQEKFAAHVGIDRSYMGAIERGTRSVGLLHIQKIADGLHLHPMELFNFD